MPHIKQIVSKDNYHLIGEMMENVYLYYYGGTRKTYAMGVSGIEAPYICFDVRTYSFVGVASSEDVKGHGVLV
jgi:hypothetical protein